MGNVDIELPTAIPPPSPERKPLNIDIDYDDQSDPVLDQKDPVKKKPSFIKRHKKPLLTVILVVGLIVGGILGALLAFQAMNPITGVQIFVEPTDNPETTSVRILVNSGMLGAYTGSANVQIRYGSEIAANVPVRIVEDMVHRTIPYKDFYRSNGDYTFSIELEGFSDQYQTRFTKTAENIRLGMPIGYVPRDHSVAQHTVTIDFALRVSGVANPMNLKDVLGSGRATLFANQTNDELAYAEFSITGETRVIDKVSENLTYDSDMHGDYVLQLVFRQGEHPAVMEPPVEAAYFIIEFENELESTPVSETTPVFYFIE